MLAVFAAHDAGARISRIFRLGRVNFGPISHRQNNFKSNSAIESCAIGFNPSRQTFKAQRIGCDVFTYQAITSRDGLNQSSVGIVSRCTGAIALDAGVNF